MKQILCIEDNHEMSLMLEGALMEHQITRAQSIGEAKAHLINKNNKYDLMTLDLGLPDGDGIHFLDELSNHLEWKQIPVFILTSDDEIAKKIKAFSYGVEDYLVKPVNPVELKARVNGKFIRDLKTTSTSLDKINIGNINIHVSKQKVNLSDTQELLDLTSLELRMFITFIENKNTILKRDFLLNEVWGTNMHLSDRTVDTHVGHLRKKIQKSNVQIQTVIGEGYRLVIENESL